MNANDNLGNNSLANIYRGAAYGDIVALKDLYDIYEMECPDVRRTTALLVRMGLQLRNIGI